MHGEKGCSLHATSREGTRVEPGTEQLLQVLSSVSDLLLQPGPTSYRSNEWNHYHWCSMILSPSKYTRFWEPFTSKLWRLAPYEVEALEPLEVGPSERSLSHEGVIFTGSLVNSWENKVYTEAPPCSSFLPCSVMTLACVPTMILFAMKWFNEGASPESVQAYFDFEPLKLWATQTSSLCKVPTFMYFIIATENELLHSHKL